MRRATWFLILLLCVSLAVPAAASGKPAGFSDLSGHWAAGLVERAVGAGYVNGYPDGTFRPNAAVTRAESVKLLVTAGKLGMISGWGQGFTDVPANHWVLAQGYLSAATYYGVVPVDESAFRPDVAATRLEFLTMALRLLGRPYSDPPEPTTGLPFTDSIPESGRRYVQEGLKLGLVQGYPDGTFRPGGTVTRAEALAIVERTIQVMAAGTDASLHLVVNGRTVSDAALAVRDGYVWAPGNAIYMDPRVQDWRTVHARGVWAQAANDRFTREGSVLEIHEGDPVATLFTSYNSVQSMPLTGTPYFAFDQVMIPVAPVGGKGSLPYAEAVHDATTGAVTVTFTPDWPGNTLAATPDQLSYASRDRGQVRPEDIGQIALEVPRLIDPNGSFVVDREHPPVTFSVDPAGPLRLRDELTGSLTTTYTLSPANGWNLPKLAVVADPTEGTFAVTISASTYKPGKVQLTLVDTQPYQVTLAPVGTWKAGQSVSLQATVLDRHGRVSPVTYVYFGMDNNPTPNPQISVTGPDGNAVEARPELWQTGDAPGVYEYWGHAGVGTFTFTPPVAGTYHVKVAFRLRPPNPDLTVVEMDLTVVE